MKRVIVGLMVAVVLLSGCGGDKRIVVDAGGIGTERDVMISEAAQNTQRMDAEKGSDN